MDSRGTILFQQERIGIHNRRFKILKFRSMYIDSEKNGPQLSSENDTGSLELEDLCAKPD